MGGFPQPKQPQYQNPAQIGSQAKTPSPEPPRQHQAQQPYPLTSGAQPQAQYPTPGISNPIASPRPAISAAELEKDNDMMTKLIQQRLTQYQTNQQAQPPQDAIQQQPPKQQPPANLNQSFKLKRSVFKQNMQSSMISQGGGGPLDGDTEDDSLTLQVDDNGFLLDKEGYPVIGDDGLPIKLTEENLEFFKENNLYSEEVV